MQNANHENDQMLREHDPMPLGLQFQAYFNRLRNDVRRTPRRLLIAAIMGVALLAFEIFNYDTTRYALNNLLGDTSFMNIGWASILAIAFCSIDFAGLVRIFTPERGREEPKEVWYLMGAWLMGATMNAMMTWWAVSLTVLNHDVGSEIIPHETMLKVVPIFVAVLVWLTRILFIGALSVAGEQLMAERWERREETPRSDARPRQQTQTIAVRQRRAVHLKERTHSSHRPRSMARSQTLIVNGVPKPIVARVQPEETGDDPLAQLFEAKPTEKQVRPTRTKRVQRPNGSRRKPKRNLQATPRQ